MSTSFKLKINKYEPQHIDAAQLEELNIRKISRGNYHIIHQNQSLNAEVKSDIKDPSKLKVIVEGKEYDFQIISELDDTIDELGFELQCSENDNTILAPMPGVVLQLKVSEGDEVEENSPLIILEAMKMENVLVAPKKGTITSIQIAEGDTVSKGDLLIEIE